MKTSIAIVLGMISCAAIADCKTELPVTGVQSLPACNAATQVCLPPEKALQDFLSKTKDDSSVLSLASHASPWHAYDGDFRILTIDDLAGKIRQFLAEHKTVKRVELLGSWTGVRPAANSPSIAERLSKTLQGFPVSGAQGFQWVSANGGLRTTRQAATVSVGPYLVANDGEVMASAIAAWPMFAIDTIRQKRDAKALRLAGAAWDIFGLCPDNALATYEEAAGLGDTIAAYNAAQMRLQRGMKADIDRATTLLAQAANAGDAASRAQLAKLKSQGR